MNWRQQMNFGPKKVPAKPAVEETRLSVIGNSELLEIIECTSLN